MAKLARPPGYAQKTPIFLFSSVHPAHPSGMTTSGSHRADIVRCRLKGGTGAVDL